MEASQIYLDDTLVYQGSNAVIEVDQGIPTLGSHRITVKFWTSAGMSGSQSITVNVAGTLNSIKHVFFMLQENRSFDNYFGRMGQYRRDRGYNDPFDELPLTVSIPDANGLPLSPFHQQTVCTDDLSPAWDEAHYDVDGGKMDNFAITAQGTYPTTNDPGGTRVMGYYDWTDLPYYYEMAFQFATSDRWFASVLTNTYPNRMYSFAGTSMGHAFPATPPSGGWPNPTIFDRLNAAGISWRYYYLDTLADTFITNWSSYYANQDKIFPISQYYQDIQNESTMPQVIYIERSDVYGYDEHPGHNIQEGAAKVKQIMDALMASPTWGSSVFFLGFDEPGGLYEHVPPVPMPSPDGIKPIDLKPQDLPGDFTTSGMRVPLMVVSPWVKPHFVSHVTRDTTSILKFIETRFNLAPLTQRDANADNMLEFFDFTAPHWPTPPPLPAQPTNGLCDWTAERAPGH